MNSASFPCVAGDEAVTRATLRNDILMPLLYFAIMLVCLSLIVLVYHEMV